MGAAMQQVIQYIRGISAAQFAGIVLLFFLPFVEVSCGNMFTVDISGQQFATGGKISVPNAPNLNAPSATPAPTATTPEMKDKDIEPKLSAMIAWGAAVLGIILSLMVGRVFRIATAAVGGAGAVTLFWLKSQIEADFSVQGMQQLQGMIQLNFKFAFWLCFILFLTAAATNVYMLLKPPDAARPAA